MRVGLLNERLEWLKKLPKLTWRDIKLKGLADLECDLLDKLGDWPLEALS